MRDQRYSLILGPLWCSLLLASLITSPSAAREVSTGSEGNTVTSNPIGSEGNTVTSNPIGSEGNTVTSNTYVTSNIYVYNPTGSEGNTVTSNPFGSEENTVTSNPFGSEENTVTSNPIGSEENTVINNNTGSLGINKTNNTNGSKENTVTSNPTGSEGNTVINNNTGSNGNNKNNNTSESGGNTVPINSTGIIVITVTKNAIGSEGNNVTNNTTGSKESTVTNNITGDKLNTVTSNNIIKNGKDICLTKGCVKAASKIMEMMDDDANPCDDFERFACGNYHDNIMTSNGSAVRYDISFQMTKIVRNLLKENITDEDSDGIKIVKAYYNTCMDEDKIEERGLAPLQDILAKLGGWPVVEGDNWDPSTYNWTQNLYKMRELGYSSNQLFNLFVGSDDKNSSWNILQVFQTSTNVKREDLLKGFNDSNIQAYYEYQLGLATLLGADKKRAERELKEGIEFEIEIAKIILPAEEARNYTERYNKMTLNDLQMLVPDIPWLEYSNKILSPIFSVNSSEPIVVYSEDFLKNMSALINKTPERILANYIIWDVVKGSVTYLNDAALNLKFKYEKKVDGREDKTSRRWTCSNRVRSEFAIGNYYIRKYFKEDAKYATEEMVKYIHKAFNDKLQSLDWLDDETRKMALQKSESIYSSVAYPVELLNDTKISEYYEGLSITEGDLLEQELNWVKFNRLKSLKKFRTKRDKRSWEKFGKTTSVNAFYSFTSNSIAIHAGILRQGVYFDVERPMYLNYGGIGSVIGHEISHGFDDNGRKYDINGDVHSWWESETERKYKEKSQCIIDQYGNFTIPQIDLKMNGKLTVGENIADNGGIKDAYHGYKKWVKNNGEEPLLPGLPYTQSQLFWVSNANLRCSKPRTESLKNGISTNEHSPDRFRINGPMMNNVDFARDFNCPVGSSMNPKDKCELW